MVSSNINAVLSELGWGDGFRIPVANEENKRLEEEIEKKMKLKETLSTNLEIIEDRKKTVQKHVHNLAMQRDINQKLLAEHSAQLEAENHRYRLSCNIESGLRQEARNFEKEWKEINDVIANVEKELRKITHKIESSKKAIKFDESNLRNFEEMLNKNTEDNQLIERIMKEDSKAYKELELERQKLAMNYKIYQEMAIRVTDETNEMEIVLDRTSKVYNATLKEGEQIYNCWKESVAILQQRDDDIEKVLREIDTLNEVFKEKKQKVEEHEKFYEEQLEDNRTVQDSIKQLEKKQTALREEEIKIKDMIALYETEFRIQRNVLRELTEKTQETRRDIVQKQSEMERKYNKIEDMKKQIDQLTQKLKEIENQSLNLEEKTNELEKMMEEQAKRKAIIINETNRLQTANLRTTKQIKELEGEIKVLELQSQNEWKTCDYLDTLYAKEKKVLDEKKETLYQVEFELQKAEMTLERLRGRERDKSEVEKKQQKIQELQTILSEKTDIVKLIQKQIANLEQDMKKVTNSLTNDNTELHRLRSKKQDLILLLEGGENRVKTVQNRNEEKLVEQSLLQLKVSQMEKLIANLSDNVYNLERYRLELEAAVRERKAEIAIQEESLLVQKRIVANECSELRNAIVERNVRTRQLQARYDNGIAMLGKNPDGTAKSTAYLKIQSAQEKFLLQEQGDKLDEAIRRTEQEIRSMENTLRVINVCNDKYKMRLQTEDEEQAEQEEQRKLEIELREVEQNLKRMQEELECETGNIRKMEQNYMETLKKIEAAQEEEEQKERYLADLKRQINEQKEKLLRAEKDLRMVQKEIRNNYTSTGDRLVLVQEKEVELRDIREQNAMILQDIAEFTIRHVEAEAYVKKFLAVKEIELPSVSLFEHSSRQSQCPSTTSSLEYLPKSTDRASAFPSSRESIGSIVNIEAQFQTTLCENERSSAKTEVRVTRSRQAKRVQIQSRQTPTKK